MWDIPKYYFKHSHAPFTLIMLLLSMTPVTIIPKIRKIRLVVSGIMNDSVKAQ